MSSIRSSGLKRYLFAVLPVEWILALTLRLRPFGRLIFLVLFLAAVMFTASCGVGAAPFFVAMPVFRPSVLLDTSSIVSWGALSLLVLVVGWLVRTRRKAIERSTRNQHLHQIYQLTNAVARSDTLETIYEEALNALAQSLKPDRAAVLLFDADRRMCFKAWRGLSEGYRKAVEGHSPWPAESRNPEPITIASVAADSNLGSLKEVISREGISAMAFIPLVCRDRLLGKFMIYYDSVHEFTPEEIHMAQTIASQIALALERTRTAEELKLYREIFAKTTDGIEITDSQGRYLEQNAAQRALLGYSDDELRGRTPAIHLGDEVFARIASELASSGRYSGELTSRSASGQMIPVDLSAFSIKNEAGSVLCQVGIKRDITQRRRSQQRLATQHAVTRILADAPTLGAAASRILEAVCNLLDWDVGVLWSVDQDAGVLACLEVWHRSDVTIPEFEAISRRQTFYSGIGLPGRVWASGKPAWIADVTRDSNFSRSPVAAREGLHGAFGFPITLGNDVLGVMEFFRREIREPDDALLQMFAIIGGQVGQFDARNRAQAALSRNEQDFSDFFENAPVAIHWVDSDGYILRANGAELKMLGYAREEYVGHHISEFHTDQAVVSDILHRLAAGETLHDREARLLCRDGSIRHGLISANVQWENGKFVHTRCVTRDVTERVRAGQERAQILAREQAARAYAEAAELRFRDLVNSLDAIVWEADATTFRFTFVSQRAQQILGYPVERWLGEPDFWVNLLHFEDREEAVSLRRNATQGGEDHDIEYRVVASDGRVLWMHDIVHVIRDQAGKSRQLRGLMVNISERKEDDARQRFMAEARPVLASSLDYATTLATVARLTLPGLADGCVVDLIDDDGEIRRVAQAHVNPSKESLLQDLPFGMDAGKIGTVLSTGQPAFYAEIPVSSRLDSNGSETPLDLHQGLHRLREIGARSLISVPLRARGRTLGTITLFYGESGRYYRAADLALAEDLARRAALAIDNARLYREAQEASRIKDEFLATVSHELRTPLNAVFGWARMLRTRPLDPETSAQALETIERNARLQTQIIEDILEVSRIITGKLRLNVGPVELVPILEAAIDSVRLAADAKGIRLNVFLDPQVEPASGDPERLQQVVWNLLSNAIKFTPEGGTVEIKLMQQTPQASHARIVVKDTGNGIRPDLLPFVFDRFRQGDSSTGRRYGGLGLGLAIVRHLVELHGGTVSAESAGEGQGATFLIELPLIALRTPSKVPVQEPKTAAPVPAFVPELKGLRILVVDDDTDGRGLIAEMLQHYGASVTTFSSASELLNALPQSCWDFLVSDIGMPDIDGYELINRVRRTDAGHHLPAIALSAYAREEDRKKAVAAGYQMHLAKPVEPSELAAAIAGLVAKARKTAEA
jgi:PAS domain S-box-containing protein